MGREDGHPGEDMIVTPFAQILASIKNVRNNYVCLTNVNPDRHPGEDMIVTPFAQILASIKNVRNNYVCLTNVNPDRTKVFLPPSGDVASNAPVERRLRVDQHFRLRSGDHAMSLSKPASSSQGKQVDPPYVVAKCSGILSASQSQSCDSASSAHDNPGVRGSEQEDIRTCREPPLHNPEDWYQEQEDIRTCREPPLHNPEDWYQEVSRGMVTRQKHFEVKLWTLLLRS
ncbi:unnamed protein product [Cyprideis torosa]|uniref:3',5'-cyclic-AMP phosphodiesterase n=1 Tax=Cyprideis torosa TaxID=163714 RepID=A0A7R8WLE6_9CRUS|nr:unnamed protein product [Cyprideis torosa]CAG0898112.1 unnamed protein product [Cyprideis torosa]